MRRVGVVACSLHELLPVVLCCCLYDCLLHCLHAAGLCVAGSLYGTCGVKQCAGAPVQSGDTHREKGRGTRVGVLCMHSYKLCMQLVSVLLAATMGPVGTSMWGGARVRAAPGNQAASGNLSSQGAGGRGGG